MIEAIFDELLELFFSTRVGQLILGPLLLIAAWGLLRDIVTKRRCTRSVKGLVRQSTCQPGKEPASTRYDLTLSYEVDGAEYTLSLPGEKAEPEDGSVPLLCDPNRPERAICESRRPGWAMYLVPLFVAAMGVWALYP